MAFSLLLLIPMIGIPLIVATAGGVYTFNNRVGSSDANKPLIRELPQDGLTSCTLRPQFRTNNKLLNVYSRTGSKIFRFVRHQTTESSMRGVTYSLLDGMDATPLSTIHIFGLKSEVVFHDSVESRNLGLISVKHVVDGASHYRMFILPNGNTYQWTKDRYLERVAITPGPTITEVRERIAVARRIGTRIWEIKFDEAQLPALVVFSTALISIFDQWNTIFGVGGIFLKSDKNLTAKYQS